MRDRTLAHCLPVPFIFPCHPMTQLLDALAALAALAALDALKPAFSGLLGL